ncbi:MAG: protease complex subunit PrcB family protein [Bacteroidota bacterium]
MKKAAFVLSALFFVFSCDSAGKGSDKQTADEKPEADTTNTIVKWQELNSGSECTVQEPKNMVISSISQLDSLWSAAFTGDDKPAKPSIDFSKNSVVALFLGSVKSGGHSVSISSIQQEKNGIKIEIQRKLPGKSCIASTAIEFPFYIGLTETTLTGKPVFAIKTIEYECD